MGKIVAQTFVTLDGVMETPEKWQFPNELDSEALGAYVNEAYSSAEAVLLGRRTYEAFAGYWPSQPDTNPFAPLLNRKPKYVVTKTLKTLEWSNSMRVEGGVPDGVAKLRKSIAGSILIPGSATLVSGLTSHGLVDEYQVILHPVVVGRGKKLFQEGVEPTLFELVDTKTFKTGVIGLTYRSKGKAKLG